VESTSLSQAGFTTNSPGEVAGLDGLIEQHLSAARSLAFHLVLDHSLADDLTQEACLRAIRGYAGFQRQSSFRTWLFRIVINTSRDLFMTGQRPSRATHTEVFDLPAREHERPDRLAMQAELEKTISQAMTELPEPLRVALALTGFHGLTPQEVAEIESCATNTIYWRIHEARKLLRERLQPWT
jgi:RNA polymerase sigma-70 factor, ECF subfamily